MELAVRFIYYDETITPSMNITSLTDEQWHEFEQMNPDQRRDFMINHLRRRYVLGKVKEMCWMPLDNQKRLTIVYPKLTLEEWKQSVRDTIKLINPNFSKEDWEDIEFDLSICTERDIEYPPESAAFDILL